jgi:hypothetical protein
VGGRGRIKHGEFACASGEMSPEEFVRFPKETLGARVRHTVNRGITYVYMDWRHARKLLEAGSAVYDEFIRRKRKRRTHCQLLLVTKCLEVSCFVAIADRPTSGA